MQHTSSFLSRFISPRVNHRNDSYGGNTEKRSRILFEILDGIKNAVPELHVTIKINCSDFTFGGLDEEESIEISGNGTSVAGIKPHVNEAYFLNFAAGLAEKISVPVILVGGLRSLDIMQNILNTTKIELLSLSRPLIREPDFPNKLFNHESTDSKCISCNACYGSPAHKCVFRRK